MTKEHEKIWKDACKQAKKEKGYVPAELLMLPMFVGLAEEGLIEVGGDDNFTVISTKGDNK
tara:strand:+ start:283 stop:465 length:183 start_codon:yes stop_codon:yes gene_type:complete